MDRKVLDSSDFYKFRFQFCMVLSVVVVVFCFVCVCGGGGGGGCCVKCCHVCHQGQICKNNIKEAEDLCLKLYHSLIQYHHDHRLSLAEKPA